MDRALRGLEKFVKVPVRRVAALVLLLSAPAPLAAQTSLGAAAVAIKLRSDPLSAMHFTARAAAESGDVAPNSSTLAPVLDLTRKIHAEIRSPLAWGLIDAAVVASADVAAFRALAERMPESREVDKKPVRIRAHALALAEAYAKVEQSYRADDWPKTEAALKDAAARLEKILISKSAAVYGHVQKSLGIGLPAEVVVTLAPVAPFPGGFTLRTRGGPVCVVGVNVPNDASLCEVVLHETLHALDTLAGADNNALAELRQRLEAAGITAADAAYRDVPHTLIFVQAAASVRATLYPDHEDYGESNGYYAKAPEAVAAVRPAWERFLKGEIMRDEALNLIVQQAANK